MSERNGGARRHQAVYQFIPACAALSAGMVGFQVGFSCCQLQSDCACGLTHPVPNANSNSAASKITVRVGTSDWFGGISQLPSLKDGKENKTTDHRYRCNSESHRPSGCVDERAASEKCKDAGRPAKNGHLLGALSGGAFIGFRSRIKLVGFTHNFVVFDAACRGVARRLAVSPLFRFQP